jgi:hypothetical protein
VVGQFCEFCVVRDDNDVYNGAFTTESVHHLLAMNTKVRRLLTNAKELNASERALLVNCLISSLDSSNGEDDEICALIIMNNH